uniref:large ribosomal subunit protein uL15m n=1 Tax=Myxine glutinosa TaxID=7769 RepID=UPI00358E4511
MSGPGRTSLRCLRDLPRVSLANMRPNPGLQKKTKLRGRGKFNHGGKSGRGNKRQHKTSPPLGYEGGQTPFHIIIPKYGYNYGHSLRRQYVPLSLQRLQYLIDLGRVDTTQPVDLTQLVNGRGVRVNPLRRQYGVQLVEEGADEFDALVNLEVQWASELAIAAVESKGGVVTTAFYDLRSLDILRQPVPFFRRGQPIPRRQLPPQDLISFYTDPKCRGYLADQEEVRMAREALALRYGYTLPNLEQPELLAMLSKRKRPRQIFFGLAPGWLVSLTDREVLKPTDPQLLEFYAAP